MDAGDLENAINSAKGSGGGSEGAGVPQMSRDEEIGFHKGALSVLISERNELVKMVKNVEAIANAHAKRLKEMGVELK